MKGLVFVIAVAFACVATCGAIQCRECFAKTVAECAQEPLSNCSSGHTQCLSISISFGINSYSCDILKSDYMCIGCCRENGCITEGDFTIGGAARASIATMATTALTVLLTIAVGF
uniref:UPAR/Ly6 domain-containing protein n=1 Tax=Branchiostoma floridae TaxID=7739 RepID=C3YTU1_BRAFL|eukprot:XP_002600206.1 hypothetical protein BRAFLDRAFT_66711 [Branchiostoma floridae]